MFNAKMGYKRSTACMESNLKLVVHYNRKMVEFPSCKYEYSKKLNGMHSYIFTHNVRHSMCTYSFLCSALGNRENFKLGCKLYNPVLV